MSDERMTAGTGGQVGEVAGPEGWREHLEQVLREWLGPPLQRVQELEQRVEELGSRVQRLEERLGVNRPEKQEERPVWTEAAGFDYADPYENWIEQHPEELAKYPDCHVAIDPLNGIVLHARDDEEFTRGLLELCERDSSLRRRLLATHTSLYYFEKETR